MLVYGAGAAYNRPNLVGAGTGSITSAYIHACMQRCIHTCKYNSFSCNKLPFLILTLGRIGRYGTQLFVATSKDIPETHCSGINYS